MARTGRILLGCFVPVAALFAACSSGGESPGGGPDGGSDALDGTVTPDAAGDVGSDSASPDTGADAGTDSGGGSDASDAAVPEGGPSLCGDGGSFLFCDGFEQGVSAWSQPFVSAGSATADGTHTYRGSSALHAHVDAVTTAGVSAYAYMQQVQSWPTHVFTRVFVYVPGPLPPSPTAFLDIVQNGSPYGGIELFAAPSGALSMKTFNTDAGQDAGWASGSGVMPTGQWVCFELEVDTAAETSHVRMNDVEVTDLAKSSLTLPQLGVLGVGLSFNLPNVQGAQDAWIDEVAVSGSQIGCAK